MSQVKIESKYNPPQTLSIKRDSSGVPIIRANSLKESLWGLGYMHGTDRSSQLLLMRVLGQGRVCECLDDSEDSLALDKFFRKANWKNGLDAQVREMSAELGSHCQAYCDGINAALQARGVTIMKLLGYKADPWEIKDILLIAKMAGFITLAQSQEEVEKLFIELVQAGLSDDKLEALFPIKDSLFLKDEILQLTLQERVVPDTALWGSAIPRMMASNNWVVAGSKTASGAALMANDPHLEINRLPNVFYEAQLNWQNGEVMGMGMPGFPGITIGRTKSVSWGITYTFMDTIDSWIEDCKDGQYRRNEAWENFDKRVERIKRKKHPDVELTFYENLHGILDGNPHKTGKYLATRWSGNEMGATSFQAMIDIASASTVEEALNILGHIETGWNWVACDIEGNIGYQMSGLMPKRKADWNGFTPAPGWDPAYDWQGYISPEDLPRTMNPECGYFVTANNDLNQWGRSDPINMPMGDYRAKRIEALLEESNDHSIESMRQIQFDVYSNQAEAFLSLLLPALKANDIRDTNVEILERWDCNYELDSQGAALFERFYEQLRSDAFADEQLNAAVLKHLSEQTGVFIDFYQPFDIAMLTPESPWYQGRTLADVFVSAFTKACETYKQETWGEVNKIAMKNILLDGKLPTFLGFDTKALGIRGGRATPCQGQIYSSNGRQTSFCPAVRLIAQSDTHELHTNLAGGPSGNRFSKWYTSEVQDWLEGRLKTLSF